jgi:hypothetical protein
LKTLIGKTDFIRTDEERALHEALLPRTQIERHRSVFSSNLSGGDQIGQ